MAVGPSGSRSSEPNHTQDKWGKAYYNNDYYRTQHSYLKDCQVCRRNNIRTAREAYKDSHQDPGDSDRQLNKLVHEFVNEDQPQVPNCADKINYT